MNGEDVQSKALKDQLDRSELPLDTQNVHGKHLDLAMSRFLDPISERETITVDQDIELALDNSKLSYFARRAFVLVGQGAHKNLTVMRGDQVTQESPQPHKRISEKEGDGASPSSTAQARDPTLAISQPQERPSAQPSSIIANITANPLSPRDVPPDRPRVLEILAAQGQDVPLDKRGAWARDQIITRNERGYQNSFFLQQFINDNAETTTMWNNKVSDVNASLLQLLQDLTGFEKPIDRQHPPPPSPLNPISPPKALWKGVKRNREKENRFRK